MNFISGMFIAGICAAIWFVVFNPLVRKILLIRRTHTTWISALPKMGRVEVVGKAEGKACTSPLGNSKCIAWQVEILAEHRTKRQISWKRVYSRTSSDMFSINDGTGNILVRPEGAEIILAEGDLIQMPFETTLEILTRLDTKMPTSLKLSRNIQVYERKIHEGEEIYVSGQIGQNNGQRSFVGKMDDPLRISNRSERETLGELYWQLVRNALMTLFILLGAAIIYFGLLRS